MRLFIGCVVRAFLSVSPFDSVGHKKGARPDWGVYFSMLIPTAASINQKIYYYSFQTHWQLLSYAAHSYTLRLSHLNCCGNMFSSSSSFQFISRSPSASAAPDNPRVGQGFNLQVVMQKVMCYHLSPFRNTLLIMLVSSIYDVLKYCASTSNDYKCEMKPACFGTPRRAHE